MTSFTTINPATDETLTTYTLMTDGEAADAVERCHRAFLDWRLRPLEARAEVIKAIGEELRAHADEFAALMTREMGKLIGDGRDEIELCAAICDYTAEQGPSVLADETREHPDGQQAIVTFSPLGVIYGIQPWNFPCYQAIRYSVANLMAGNGVLLKHAHCCTGSALFLQTLIERAGLPADLFTVLIIDHDQSDAIIEHPRVRGVTLTGSDRAGKTVAAKAGAALKKTVLELGSNDAYVVLDDADLELAVNSCVTGRLLNNGQTCVNAKRFVVTAAHYDEFVPRYVEAMRAIELGDPTDEDTQLGPLARSDLRQTLHEQVEQSIAKGARLLCGGEIPAGPGAYYPATVLAEVQPGQPAYDDELFGPVASIIRAQDDDDAMRIANDSRYGLGGGIFSQDEERALQLARVHFDTGMVMINGYGIATPNTPFGGVKDSGYGREHGGFGMREFVNAKAVVLFAG